MHKEFYKILEVCLQMLLRNILASLLLTFLFFIQSSALADSSTNETRGVYLGMTTVLSGNSSKIGRDVFWGVRAALEAANRQGGVVGNNIYLFTRDDIYNPRIAVSNLMEFSETSSILAVLGTAGLQNAFALSPVSNRQRVLFYSPFAGSDYISNSSPQRYSIAYRPSVTDEAALIAKWLVRNQKISPEKIAVVGQRDGFGDIAYSGIVEALRLLGLRSEFQITHARFERNSLAVENALADILTIKERPEAVVIAGVYGSVAKFIKLSRKYNYNPKFITFSSVGTRGLIEELGSEANNIIITQVVPHYESSLPMASDFRRDLKLLNANVSESYAAFESYISTRILLKALKNVESAPTRETLIDSFEQLGEFDIGLGGSVNFSPYQHRASRRVWITELKNGRISAIASSSSPSLIGVQ